MQLVNLCKLSSYAKQLMLTANLFNIDILQVSLYSKEDEEDQWMEDTNVMSGEKRSDTFFDCGLCYVDALPEIPDGTQLTPSALFPSGHVPLPDRFGLFDLSDLLDLSALFDLLGLDLLPTPHGFEVPEHLALCT